MSAATNTDCVKSLFYKEYGDPVEVLQVTTQTIEQPAADQVIVAAIKIYPLSSAIIFNSHVI